jgi:hypothetical protein
MCRAFVYLGQPAALDHLLFQPDSALVRQSYMPKRLHMLNQNVHPFQFRACVPEYSMIYADTGSGAPIVEIHYLD